MTWEYPPPAAPPEGTDRHCYVITMTTVVLRSDAAAIIFSLLVFVRLLFEVGVCSKKYGICINVYMYVHQERTRTGG